MIARTRGVERRGDRGAPGPHRRGQPVAERRSCAGWTTMLVGCGGRRSSGGRGRHARGVPRRAVHRQGEHRPGRHADHQRGRGVGRGDRARGRARRSSGCAAAGAIPIGRTNLPDLGLRVATESSLHGITRNPWNAELTAGGSSGGEASALASGHEPDRSGQRHRRIAAQPGALLRHRVDQAVHGRGAVGGDRLPPENFSLMFQLMAVEGVMARRVADVRAGLLTVAGPHVRDPLALPRRLADVDRSAPLRVAVLAEPPGGTTHPGVAAAVRHAGDVLADHGAEVRRGRRRRLRAGDRAVGLAAADRHRRAAAAARDGDGRRAACSSCARAMHVFPSRDLAGFVGDAGRAARRREGVPLVLRPSTTSARPPRGRIRPSPTAPTWPPPTARRAPSTRSRPVVPANLLGLPAARRCRWAWPAACPCGAQLIVTAVRRPALPQRRAAAGGCARHDDAHRPALTRSGAQPAAICLAQR